jgi:hypothetical protein
MLPRMALWAAAKWERYLNGRVKGDEKQKVGFKVTCHYPHTQKIYDMISTVIGASLIKLFGSGMEII